MKKLVPESIEESLQILKRENLNESTIGQWFNTAKDLVKGMFKKVGNFFVAFFKDKEIPAMVPVNIGIMYKDGNLPKCVNYVPSAEDIQLEPALAKYKSGAAILNRVKKDYQEAAARNKSRKKISESLITIKKLDEETVPLKYSEEDKVKNVNSDFLIKRLQLQVKNPKLMPPCIWGAPGIGKTAITKGVINALGPGHRIIDVQTSKMMPDDWALPSIYKTVTPEGKEHIEARDLPKNWLPTWEPTKPSDPEEDARRDDVANDGNGGIIFLDEISRASTEVQNTCLKLVDERIIGDRKLGSKWAVVAASNRTTDDPEGGQTAMGSALANRFQHWNFVPTVDEWIAWAKGVNIDDRITTFVDFNRDHFYLFDNQSKLNTTPRTWEALSKMLAECQNYGDIIFSKSDIETIVGGQIHPKTTEQLMAFLVLIETFKPEEIKMIFTNPAKAPKPKAKGSGFDIPQANALIGAACSQSKDMKLSAEQLENYVQYWVNLGDASLAAKALWLIVETHPYIHEQTGDIKDGKHDKYLKAMNIFRTAFGKIKFGKREDVMGA
jgi:MoxR-like ATPase